MEYCSRRHRQVKEPGFETCKSESDSGKTELGHPHEPPRSRKDFLDEALLIGYDGSNMPYVMFKNQKLNLMERCPYPDRKLPLLRAACVRAAAHTIAVVISDTPGFDDEAKISMAFDRLSQRIGVRGGFVNEPEKRQIRNGPKMTSIRRLCERHLRMN